MKKTLLCWVLTALLFSSCSLLQRNTDEMEDESAPPFDPAESSQTIEQEPSMNASSVESEISRLSTKVAALETKLDVLTSNIERNQIKRSQPVIEAEPAPQPNMAAPVAEPQEEAPMDLSAAPTRPSVALPTEMKSEPASNVGSEKEFQAAMELFQSGKNLEAASRFALFAKKYPRHLLASHALYWAGEASARAQQWSIAMENWEELQKAYPRSAYVPEALAGLARAYEKQGNPSKAQMYRSTLMKAFPKSPVALSLNTTAAEPTAQPQPAADEQIPSYDEESSGEGE